MLISFLFFLWDDSGESPHCNFHLKAKQELYRKGLITSCQAIDCKRKESFFQLTKRTQPPSATSTIQLMKRPLI